MIVAFTGGRNQQLTRLDRDWLRELFLETEGIEVRVGDCPSGIDQEVYGLAHACGASIRVFYADWDRHGKKAGPIRNAEMLKGAAVLIAFPGGAGTESAKREAARTRVPVRER